MSFSTGGTMFPLIGREKMNDDNYWCTSLYGDSWCPRVAKKKFELSLNKNSTELFAAATFTSQRQKNRD